MQDSLISVWLFSPRVAYTDTDVPEVPGAGLMIKLEMGKVGELGGGPKQETHIVINISELEKHSVNI